MYNSDSEMQKLASEVHKGHRKRVIERFLRFGFESFAEHEILEMLLFYSVPRKNTNPIAHSLISRFGSLHNVFNADVSELVDAGLTENSAVLIKTIPALAGICASRQMNDVVLDTGEKVKNLFVSKFVGADNEQVWIACLDSSMRLINCEMVCCGECDTVRLQPRKVVEIALKYKCSNIFIAHNHPNGMAVASSEDIASTRNLVTTLKALDIRLVDHIIVTQSKTVSMKENGCFTVFDI